MELSNQIEGLLFYKAAPMKLTQLVKIFSVSEGELETAVQSIKGRLRNGAVRLSITETEIQLVTAPELDELIESVRKDELKRDIGKAGAETLAIVLYKGPISRVEIDRIRGVNSGFILRNLMVRGLVERGTEGKSHTFSLTSTLLSHLGITHKTELPNYATVLDQLERFEQEQVDAENA
ncbi:MAG: segregation and condensation protein B [Patiriisocius sp.]|jgi:segregation and condensation protein B